MVQSFLCIPLKNKNNRSRFSYKKARYERASLSLYLHNLTIAPRGDPKDDQVGDEKDGADAEGHDEDLATIDDTEDFENEADHMVGKGQMDKGKDEREEKDSPHLTVDGPFDLVFIEPHLLEDDEAVTVFIAF